MLQILVNMEDRERLFHAKLVSTYNQVVRYEDPLLQDLYLAHVPVDELQQRAEELQQAKLEAEKKEMSSEDCFLLVLLKWFRFEFFRGWAMMATCEECNKQGTAIGRDMPTQEDRRWEAFNIELYQCPNCEKIMRFPRYNHPQKLLETRTGRCGEWANAFTMFCVSMGFKTRYVLDWTDHVWTEVFSEAQQRWLHCDPCEAVCDNPLLYEAGWGKKLTYVIAFSKNQIMDVTWRYSNKHNEVLQRRKECREDWLGTTITNFNKQLLDQLPRQEREAMEKLYIKELVSFLTVRRDVRDEEKQGRTSGSVEWRRRRGELGETASEEVNPSYVFKPNEDDLKAGRFRVRYCTATDTYYRSLDDVVSAGKYDVKGWRNGVYSMESMFRKEEEDWKMTYLARREGSDFGRISWLMDFKESGLEIESVSIRASFKTFENGEVKMELKEDKEQGLCQLLEGGSDAKTYHLCGLPVLKLTAELKSKKSNGPNSWQHSQLFRQPLNSRGEFPLDIIVTMKKKQA